MSMKLESDYACVVPFEQLFSQWSVCEKRASVRPIQLARIVKTP